MEPSERWQNRKASRRRVWEQKDTTRTLVRYNWQQKSMWQQHQQLNRLVTRVARSRHLKVEANPLPPNKPYLLFLCGRQIKMQSLSCVPWESNPKAEDMRSIPIGSNTTILYKLREERSAERACKQTQKGRVSLLCICFSLQSNTSAEKSQT